VVACVAAQEFEGLVDVDVVGAGEGALGLFDDDAAVQGALELFGEDLGAVDGLFLE